MTYYFWLGKDADHEHYWDVFTRTFSGSAMVDGDLRKAWNGAKEYMEKYSGDFG